MRNQLSDGQVRTATLHLMVGLPCSGKTTLARQLEKERSALRLSPDDCHTRLFGNDVQDSGHDDRHDRIESILWEIAARVLTLGVDVILDFGFWARSEREEYRRRARLLGASSEIHFLDVPGPVLLERAAARNARLDRGVFEIPTDKLRA